eukprot:5332135-Pyramimonas_sp.AAC.1
MVSAHMGAAAERETAALVSSDHHPAIVRCYALEQDDHFHYLALERCACHLAALYELAPPGAGPPHLDPRDAPAD